MATKKPKKPTKRAPKIEAPSTYRGPEGHVLVLRVCRADMSSSHGFVWPTSGPVAAPDWNARAECGHGLHGWLWGAGDLSAADGVWQAEDARWLVVEVRADELVEINRKVKFPRGNVVLVGKRDEAIAMIAKHAPSGTLIMFGTATAGARGTATAGDAGTATAGARGTAMAGYAGTATAGDAGTATAGARGTAVAGYACTATAGARGTAVAGYAGTAVAGYAGTATAGYAGTAVAGYAGTATAGDAGTATAGEYGCISIEWWDAARGVYRKLVAEVDGVTIKPGVAYVVRDGRFVEKASAT